MKILYAIQATGNGHLSRAREIIPHLMEYGQVELLVSGRQAEISLPWMVQYRKKGLSYTFGKHGGIDILDSIKHLHLIQLARDIQTFPVHQYDLVINDFEPVSAWSCKVKHKTCIALSHQSAYLSNKTPRPEKKDNFAEWVFRNYAPSTFHYGFHFKAFDENIYTPVIRKEIRELETSNRDHITVYLPAHADEVLIPHFEKIKEVKWEVFSKHTKQAYKKGHISISPVNNEGFIQSMATGDGVITAGGFESVAEAIHLRKKVMVIPMTNQYEQQCNAVAARDIGVTMVKTIDSKFPDKIKTWLNYSLPPKIYYPDITGEIIGEVVRKHKDNNVTK